MTRTKTTATQFEIDIARDLLETPDADPTMIEWARHILTLPHSGDYRRAPGHETTPIGDDDRRGGQGTGTGRGGSKPAIMASEKQLNALVNMGAKKLIGEATVRHLTADLKVQDIVDRAGRVQRGATDAIVTKGEASAALDFLFAAPWRPRETRPAATPTTARPRITEDGMYKLGERIIKVQIAKNGSGNLYAKELVGDVETGFGFEYTPGLINEMAADAVRMTLDEAKTFGQLYGVCCVCSRPLTDETSIAEGIGPVCAGRM